MNKALKIFAFIVTVILLCGVTVSCGKDDPEPEKPKTTETIIMFFPYSGLESAIEKNISDMKTAIVNRGGLDTKRLIVCQAWNQAFMNIYEVKYEDGACRDSMLVSKMPITFNSYNQIETTSTLESIFLKVKEWSPMLQGKYSMIIGSHGNAWLPAGKELDSFSNSGSKRRAFGTAFATNQIDNKTLATALQNVGMHLEYLLFDACYMGNIETAYDFRNTCDYFIASPNEILSYGVPYATIGDALLNHDYKAVVDGYFNFYSTYKYHYGSFSVIDCKELENTATIVQQINQKYLSKDADLSKVQIMDGMYKTAFFDLQDYMDNFCTDPNMLNSLSQQIKRLVPYACSTKVIYTAFNSSKTIYIDTYCGISTSQPTVNEGLAELLRNTTWWNATH